MTARSGEITESVQQWHQLGRHTQTLATAAPSATTYNAPAPPQPKTATLLHPILQTNMKQNAIPSHRPAFIPPNRRRAPVAAPAPTPAADAPTFTPDVTATTVQLVGGQYSSLVDPPNLPPRLKNLFILPIATDEVRAISLIRSTRAID